MTNTQTRVIKQINKTILATCSFIFLFGFFLSSATSTILIQTNEWSILTAAILISIVELFNYLKHKFQFNDRKSGYNCFFFINLAKLGLLYGLFIDAFKLGS
uniref:Uncharacterized protein ycf20 n=1 Tax=Cyanidium caldarium TaxID=2771 RepID=YCF20_CYACA|nr:hypothetical protein JXY51_pgp152 [Cyanidium caldarium]Q9MVP1.1 RecName: Full=Uncharacterized protein ycf20 [Cyanidium caldarium]AAF26453.1 unknown [Cyanidium caldarium]WDB00196.1 hypothetical protein CDCA019_074 [Cyanidium caldarium]